MARFKVIAYRLNKSKIKKSDKGREKHESDIQSALDPTEDIHAHEVRFVTYNLR